VTEPQIAPRWRRWWSVGGALVGLAALTWIFARLDYAKFAATLAGADLRYLILVPVAIATEQLVRAWKWRQLLYPLRPIATARLFGAIMAGYLSSILVPFGVSPLVRSWLVARLEGLRMSTVLATVAVDRLIDGIVFAGLVAVVVAFAIFPDPAGGIRTGLIVGGGGSLVLFLALLFVLAQHRRQAQDAASWLMRLVARLPGRFVERTQALLRGFGEGVVWPAQTWRQVGVVGASVAMKLIAATHFLWSGLAYGVLLGPLDYLFLIAFLGFLVILTHFARLAGGFIIGAIFALDLFGVSAEQATAMVLTVQVSSLATVATVGSVALWRSGVALGDLPARENPSHACG
jgi:hypothetical protein